MANESLYLPKLKLNQQVIGLLLMAVFLVTGISFILMEIQEDYKGMLHQLESDNEIISDEYMFRFLLAENVLDKTISGLVVTRLPYRKTVKQPLIMSEGVEEGWEGFTYDRHGNKIYFIGTGEYELEKTAFIANIERVISSVENFRLLNLDGGYFYQSTEYEYFLFYPFGDMKDLIKEDEKKIQMYIQHYQGMVNNDEIAMVSGDEFIKLRSVKTIENTDYIGVNIINLREVLHNVETNIDSVILYSQENKIVIMDTELGSQPSHDYFNPYGEDLFSKTNGDDLFYYKNISNKIIYVARTSINGLKLQAVQDNNAIIVIILLAFVMSIMGYFYLLKYRNYLDLQIENKDQVLTKSLYKSRLGYVMNTISEAFIRADSDFYILEINQAAADMLGYKISEMLDHSMTAFVEQPDIIRQMTEQGLYNRYELTLMCKDGHKLYGLVNQSTIIKDNDNEKEHYIMITDITPLIEAQKKTEDANHSKSRFIANLSHEIRTPMNATIGYIYLMEQTELEEEQKKYLEKMDYASNSLLEVIDEILDYSKVEADSVILESITFNLKKVIMNAVSMFENTAMRKELKFTVNIDPNIPEYVIGDPYRLRQVIINLLSNAFKFTDYGIVSVVVNDLEDTHGDKDTSRVRIAIEDTGIGIAEERMNLLFEPFVQADESTTRIYGGTGLGLSICKKLVELMQGKISVHSAEGEGSSFAFEIPLMNSEPLVELEKGEVVEQVILTEQHTKKILVVEDNQLNQELLVELLRQNGNKVVVANNGKVAEEILFSEHTNRFDLVLMDIQMPVQDGYTTTENIRKSGAYKEVPIVAVTANADESTQKRIAEVGMNDYVLKPINAADLYTKISIWK